MTATQPRMVGRKLAPSSKDQMRHKVELVTPGPLRSEISGALHSSVRKVLRGHQVAVPNVFTRACQNFYDSLCG